MLGCLLILLMFCGLSKQSDVTDQEEYLLKLTPEQVRQAFDNVLNEDYIKDLAKQFATRAAAHFMKEITNHKNLLLSQLKLKRSSHPEYLYVYLDKYYPYNIICVLDRYYPNNLLSNNVSISRSIGPFAVYILYYILCYKIV